MASAGTVEVDVKGNVAPLISAVSGALSGPLSKLGVNVGANTSAFTSGISAASGAAQREFGAVSGAASSVGTSLLKVGAASTAIGVAGIAAGKGLADAFLDAGKETLKLSRLTGGTAEDMSRLRFVAQQSGIGIDKLSGSIVKLSRSASGEGKKTLDQLGVSITDASGKSRSYVDILGDLAAKFESLPNGIEKNALAMKLFGRSGADLIPLLNKGADGIAELAAKSDEFGATLSGKDLEATKDAIKNQRDFTAAIAALKVQLGRELLPAFESVAKVATGFAKAIGVIPGPIKSLVSGFGLMTVTAAAAGGALTIIGAGIKGLSVLVPKTAKDVVVLVETEKAAALAATELAAANTAASESMAIQGVAASKATGQVAAYGVAQAEAAAAQVAAAEASAASAAAIASGRGIGRLQGGAGGVRFYGDAAASSTSALNGTEAAAVASGQAIANSGEAAAAAGGKYAAMTGRLNTIVPQLIAAAVAFEAWSFAVKENNRGYDEAVESSVISTKKLTAAMKDTSEIGAVALTGNLKVVAEAISGISEAGPLSAVDRIKDFFGVFTAVDDKNNRADIAKKQLEDLGEAVKDLPADQARAALDQVRDSMIALGVPADDVKAKLKDLYDQIGVSDPFDEATSNLEGLSGALTDASKGFQGLTSLAQLAVDPFLSLAEANLSLEDAQDGVADAQAKYTSIVQRNTDAIKSARLAVEDANEALRKAKADTGPGSDAADSAEDAVKRAEDKLREIRKAEAQQGADTRQRTQDIAGGKQVTDATFNKDFTGDYADANRELAKAKKKRDEILTGNTEQVRNAADRVTDAQKKLNTELANSGPSSDAARRAMNDVEQAQLAAVRSAEAQQSAQATVNDTLAKFPDAAKFANGYLTQLYESGKITADTMNGVAAAFDAATASVAAFNATPVAPPPPVPQGNKSLFGEFTKGRGVAVEGKVTVGGVARGAVDAWKNLITGGGFFPGFADGGYIAKPTMAQLHANEVILPLSNPGRTAELMNKVGLGGTGGGSITINQTNVNMDPDRTADATVRGVRAAGWKTMAGAI